MTPPRSTLPRQAPISLAGFAATPAIYNTLLTLAAATVPLIGANLVPLLRETYAGPFPVGRNTTPANSSTS